MARSGIEAWSAMVNGNGNQPNDGNGSSNRKTSSGMQQPIPLKQRGKINNQPNDGAAWRLGAMVNGSGNGNNGAAWSSFQPNNRTPLTGNNQPNKGIERHGTMVNGNGNDRPSW
jgi:hypothetical protein